jgi:hypothetical protein
MRQFRDGFHAGHAYGWRDARDKLLADLNRTLDGLTADATIDDAIAGLRRKLDALSTSENVGRERAYLAELEGREGARQAAIESGVNR